MSESSFRTRLKDRKLVQWALAYLAGAWALVEASNLVVEQFHWPEVVGQGVTVVAVFGFFVALILAWYHGEKGQQRVGGTEILAIAAILGTAGLALTRLPGPGSDNTAAFFPPTGSVASEARVAVFPFENLTGNPALDDLGSVAAYWVTDGLSRTDEARPVPTDGVLRALRAHDEGASLQGIAEDLGVGTIVTGSYTAQEHGFELRAQITRVATGEVVHSIEASGTTPTEAVDALARRVMSALALAVDEIWWISRPPSYEAYQVYMRGMEIFSDLDMAGSLPHFQEAYRLDTTFVAPLIQASWAYVNTGQWASADSVVTVLESRKGGLPPDEKLKTEFLRADVDGDWTAKLRSARSLARRDPINSGYLFALTALEVGRPEDALQAFATLHRRYYEEWAPTWGQVALADHLAGRYEEQLDVARDGQNRFPDDLGLRRDEISALVAMGRLGEIAPLLDGVEEMRPEGSWHPGRVFRSVAVELARHGHATEAPRLAARAIEWYRATEEPSYGRGEALALLLADRPVEALDLVRLEAADAPDDLSTRGLYGIALARTGDHAGAEAVAHWLEELERPYLLGEHTYWRAAIAAHLDQKEEALRLLRQALQEGRPVAFLHADPWVMPLWGYEPFEQVVGPKG